jgi:hypothetical protein
LGEISIISSGTTSRLELLLHLLLLALHVFSIARIRGLSTILELTPHIVEFHEYFDDAQLLPFDNLD